MSSYAPGCRSPAAAASPAPPRPGRRRYAYVSSLSYSERDQPALIRYGNDTQTAYTYYGKEQNFRLQRIRSGTGTGTDVLQDLRYEYDRKGNVTHLEDGGESLAFSYDALDRLTGTSGTYSETYQYDETGNLKSKGDVGYGYNPAGADLLPPPPPPPLPYRTYLVMLMGNGPYAYPPANDGQPHAVISDTQGFQASYDANGNMTLRLENGITYQQGWDEENRLTVVTDTTHSAVTRFSYDGLGALVRKDLQEGAGITTTLYLGNIYERVLGEAPQETLVLLRRRPAGGGAGGRHAALPVHRPPGQQPGQLDRWDQRERAEVHPLRRRPSGRQRQPAHRLPLRRAAGGQSLNLYWMGSRWYDPYL